MKKWEELPIEMQVEEVRPYYEVLKRKQLSLFFKRVFDIVVSSLMLIILSPVFLILAIAIKLDSPGPVFFRQVRVTQYGKQFRIFKFRTMVSNAEKIGTQVTVGNDSRVTRIGKLIRKYKLDEIAQLIDVLRGMMTFVGVRPEVVKYVEKYTPEMRATLLRRAGVTNLTSIFYSEEAVLLSNVEDADRTYVEEFLPRKMKWNLIGIMDFSFCSDIKLMFMTFFAVCGKEYKTEKRLKKKGEPSQLMKSISTYDKIDVLFFERPLVDLRKFAFKIAKCLKEENADIKIGAVCVEIPMAEEVTRIDYFFHRKSIKDIDKFLLVCKVKVIVFTNSRIPDLEFILHAKKLNIKTVMLQEGVMFDGMNINDVTVNNVLATFGYFGKTASYINILRTMCVYDGTRFLGLISKILKVRKNITHIVARYFSNHLICDYILTMGRYWDDYYINQIGYTVEQIRLIGDHDLDEYTVSASNEPAICYIANVLVEDGTVKKNDFMDFLEAFANAVDKKTKLYIKLHPRSDQELYSIFSDHNVEFLKKAGALPSTTIYVGHRSALLGRALYESDNLIIWRFSNEEVCFYERFATAVCTNKDELEKVFESLDINKVTNNKRNEVENVYWKNPNGAINSAASIIYRYQNGDEV